MNEYSALLNFWNGFGIPAYVSTNVPKNAEYPYLTYEVVKAKFGAPVFSLVNTYHRTSSEAEANALVKRIEDVLQDGGVRIAYESGFIWVTMGDPFAQSVPNEDKAIRQRYININYEFIGR